MINKWTIVLVVLLVQFASATTWKNIKPEKTIERIVAFPIPCDLVNLNHRLSEDSIECGKHSRRKGHSAHKFGGKNRKFSFECRDGNCGFSHECRDGNCGFSHECGRDTFEDSSSFSGRNCGCHSKRSRHGGSSSSRKTFKSKSNCHHRTPKIERFIEPKEEIIHKLECEKKILPCIDCEKFALPEVEIQKIDLPRACNCIKTFMEKKARLHCEKVNCLQSVIPPFKFPQFHKLCGCSA